MTAPSDTAAGTYTPKNDTPLSKLTMMLYGFGQTGGQIFRDAPASLLPLFMSTMLGVAPWLAGVVVLIPKLWVIVCDPLMGAFSDRLKPKHSRRPFLLWGGLATGLLFVALFSFSGFASQWVAALVVGVIFFFASTAFSAFSVPYLAAASELSEDPHERTTLLSFRIIFTVVGVILGIGMAQPLVFKLGGDAAAWQQMAIIFGVVSVITMAITAVGIPQDFGAAQAHQQPGDLRAGLAKVWQNRPFVVLSSAYLVQSIAQASGYAVVGFIFIYAIGDINLLLPFILIMSCGSIVSQPMWLKLSRQLGKIAAFWMACLGWIGVTITWLWVGQSDDVFVTAPFMGELSSEKTWVLLRAFIIGVTNSGFALLSYSLLTDTINIEREKSGAVDEGLFSGIFTALEKLGFALGPLVAGIILSAAGFQASVGGAVEQESQAIFGMVFTYSVIPAVCMAISLLIFTQYKKALRQF